MSPDRFAGCTEGERAILFEALLLCIESNSGIGFRSYCQDHPDYRAGAASPAIVGSDNGDSNSFFQMLRELSLHLADSDYAKLYHRRYGITDWQQFCKKAVESAERHPNARYVPLHEREGYYGSPA